MLLPAEASWLAPSTHSPTAHCRLWAYPDPELPCVTAEASRHVKSTQGMLLEYLVLVARRDYIARTHRTKTIKEIVWGRLPPQGTA